MERRLQLSVMSSFWREESDKIELSSGTELCSLKMLTAAQICKFLLHFSAFLIYSYGFYYDTMYVQTKLKFHLGFEHSDFAGRAKYLTIWNLCLQLVFFMALAVEDVHKMILGEGKERRGSFNKTMDYIFAALAFPLATLVSVLFWGLYAVDRELIFPTALDAFFPTWLNHVMHTIILPVTCVEMFITHHPYPSRWSGLTGITIAGAVYIIWTFVVAYVSGVWTYPVMQVLGWRGKGLFFIGSTMTVMGIYLCGEMLNTKIWDGQTRVKVEKKKRNKAA